VSEPTDDRGPKTRTFWRAVGGRKVFGSGLFTVLITAMVWVFEDASYDTYVAALGVALLGTSALVAAEDTKRMRYGRDAKSEPPDAGRDDASPPPQTPEEIEP
jgi:hypothetical protein